MNLNNYFWYFDRALSNRFCDKVIEFGNQRQDDLAGTGGVKIEEALSSQKKKKNLLKQRNSNVTWLSDWWIYKEIMPYVYTANKNAGWNFEISTPEEIQFTKYKLNQHYDWHQDAWPNPYENHNNSNLNNKIRKLSVTCQLTDGNDYEGGNLFFDTRNKDKKVKSLIECKDARNRGTIIVFPSFVWHKVKAVTKGIRYSLVVWTCGEMYK
jgi:PKHD-type hydroxylase